MFEEYLIFVSMSFLVFTIKYDAEMIKNEMIATKMREICEIKSLYLILAFPAPLIKNPPTASSYIKIIICFYICVKTFGKITRYYTLCEK